MFAKFTNAAEDHRGNPIYINPNQVAAVYEFARQPGGSLVTMIYGGPTGVVWEVEESLTTVLTKFNFPDC